MLNEDEVQRRKPVWKAFSEFFLDTSLDDDDLLRIARVALASGSSESELRDIYLYEVAPAVGLNRWWIAGEWAGFDEPWLYERCTRRANHHSPYVRLFAFLHRTFPLLTYLGDLPWYRMRRRLRQLGSTRSAVSQARPSL